MNQNGLIDTREQCRVKRGQSNVEIAKNCESVSNGMDKVRFRMWDGCYSHVAAVGSLVRHNDLVEGRIVPRKP